MIELQGNKHCTYISNEQNRNQGWTYEKLDKTFKNKCITTVTNLRLIRLILKI